MHPHELGRRSESIACDYLIQHGWTIVDRNWRAGHKEIDIVARKQDTIAFVEVKARGSGMYGHGLEAITWKKRREIGQVARAWLAKHYAPGLTYRFDAIAITWRGRSYDIEHIENAWYIVRR